MERQQKKIELNRELTSSKINEAIEQLESNLREYQQAQNYYQIQVGILEILQTIAHLKCQLADLSEI